ncbi:MAG: alpha/beta fold hydrolase, partial [Pseudomonadota bacterium]
MDQKIHANGAEIAYRFDGPEDGPVVMMSNSLASNYSMWDAQIPALTDKYRVLRYDQRGHGGSEPTEPPYHFDLLLDDACALLEALGIEKVHFCGLSMGGMTGQLFGAKRPEMLRSLILCDTTSKMPDPSVWDDRVKAARDDGMPSLVDSTLERWFTAPYRAASSDEVARVGEMIANTHADGFVGCCHAIKPMDHTPLLSGIKTPTLIIVGEDDPSTTVEHSEIIHREIVGSKLVVLE